MNSKVEKIKMEYSIITEKEPNIHGHLLHKQHIDINQTI